MKALQEMEYLGEGGGGVFLQQDQRNDWCVIFPSESALNYCNAHMLPIVMHICCHLLGPDTLLNQQIPGQSFGRNIDKMES